jgi:hypothetical protein
MLLKYSGCHNGILNFELSIKKIIMKKSSILKNLSGLILVCSALFITSCVKNRNSGAVDFTQLTPIVQIVEGGLAKFSSQALVFPGTDLSDTGYFTLNYAATNVAPSDITITLGKNDAARLAYNAANPTSQYLAMPDSVYSFTTTSVTIKAGQSYSSPVKFTIYPYKLDVSKSYMLPISITAAGGINISGNFGTIYYHVIGNPLAGTYQDYGMRYNYSGGVTWASGPAANLPLATAPGVPNCGNPAGFTATTTYNFTNGWSPVNSQTVTASIGNVPDPSGGSAYYYLTGDATFATISLDYASTWYAGYSNTERWTRAYVPPSPTQKPAFRLITHYNNTTGGAGNDRIIDETFIHL